MCNFYYKIWIFGAKSNFLFLIAIFINRAYHQYTQGHNFDIRTPPKKFRFRSIGHFRGSPRFLAFSGHSHSAIVSTLNFGFSSTKLGGTVPAINKIAHNDNGLCPGRIYGERTVFYVWPKNVFFPKKHPKLVKD